jgi:hypothetical protein
LAVVLATALATWKQARFEMTRQEREHVLKDVSRLLADNAKLIAELERMEGVRAEGAILATYLDMIRKDGVPKHSSTKRGIDQLVENNSVIVALTHLYLERGGSARLRTAAVQYVDYAATFRDRWQSVFELFMAGGNMPSVSSPTPTAFGQALEAERSGHRDD